MMKPPGNCVGTNRNDAEVRWKDILRIDKPHVGALIIQLVGKAQRRNKRGETESGEQRE